MRNTFLVAKVNFGVSVALILSFGIFMTSTILKIAHYDDPISNTMVSVLDAEVLP